MLHPTRKDTLIYAILAFAPPTFTMLALAASWWSMGGTRPWHEYFQVVAVATGALYALLGPALLLLALARGVSRILPIPVRQDLALTSLRAEDVLLARIRPPLAWIGSAAALIAAHAAIQLVPISSLESGGLWTGLAHAAWFCLLGPAGLLAGAILTDALTRRPGSEFAGRLLGPLLVVATLAVWGAIAWAYLTTDPRGPRTALAFPLVAAAGAWLALAARARFLRAADALYRFEDDPDAPPVAPRIVWFPGIAVSTGAGAFGRDLVWLAAWIGATAIGAMLGLTLDRLFAELAPSGFPYPLGYRFFASEAVFPILTGVLIARLQSRTLAWRGWKIHAWAATTGLALGAALAWTRFTIQSYRHQRMAIPRSFLESELPVAAVFSVMLFVALAWLLSLTIARSRKALVGAAPAFALAAFALFHSIHSSLVLDRHSTMAYRSGTAGAYLLGLLVFGLASGAGVLILERLEARNARPPDER